MCVCRLTVPCDECMAESYVEVIISEAHNLTLFGNGGFTEVVKARIQGS